MIIRLNICYTLYIYNNAEYDAMYREVGNVMSISLYFSTDKFKVSF